MILENRLYITKRIFLIHILSHQEISNRNQISVVIICQDEEDNIARCIRSVQSISDDIIIVDSGSTDHTIEIAKDLGARIFQCEWEGYGKSKNYGNSKAKHDWILSIDADECLDKKLTQTILNTPLQKNSIYQVNVLTNYCGKWIRYSGWHPLWRSRLFYNHDHSWNNAVVHEQLTNTTGKNIVQFQGKLLHYSYPTASFHKAKSEQYALLKAQQWIEAHHNPSLIKKCLGPTFRFVRTYFFKFGFLDGRAGWQIAKGNYSMMRQAIQFYHKITYDDMPSSPT